MNNLYPTKNRFKTSWLMGAGHRGPLLYFLRQPILSSPLCPGQQLRTVSDAGQHLEQSGLSISLGVCLLVSERWSHRCRQTPGLTLADFSRRARTTWVFSPLWSPPCALKCRVSPLFPHSSVGPASLLSAQPEGIASRRPITSSCPLLVKSRFPRHEWQFSW